MCKQSSLNNPEYNWDYNWDYNWTGTEIKTNNLNRIGTGNGTGTRTSNSSYSSNKTQNVIDTNNGTTIFNYSNYNYG